MSIYIYLFNMLNNKNDDVLLCKQRCAEMEIAKQIFIILYEKFQKR